MTHWRTLINPPYLGAYAIEDGQDLIVTIKSVSQELVKGQGGTEDMCPVMRFDEDIKPMIVNATNFKTLTKMFATPQVEQWYGKKIALYADRNVRFGGETVEGLRIRPRPPVEDRYCADCGELIRPDGKYTASQIASGSLRKYGAALCMTCASARKETPDGAA